MSKKRYECNVCGWRDKPWRGDIAIYKYSFIPRRKIICPVCKAEVVEYIPETEKVYGDDV